MEQRAHCKAFLSSCQGDITSQQWGKKERNGSMPRIENEDDLMTEDRGGEMIQGHICRVEANTLITSQSLPLTMTLLPSKSQHLKTEDWGYNPWGNICFKTSLFPYWGILSRKALAGAWFCSWYLGALPLWQLLFYESGDCNAGWNTPIWTSPSIMFSASSLKTRAIQSAQSSDVR